MPRHKDAERNQVMSETRRLLLDAATAEFAREGYNGANINRISRAAGFAKGTIYNYFPSKRALMLSLIDEIAASHHRFVAEQVWQEEEPIRRLQRFFQAGLEFKRQMAQGYQPMHQLIINDILALGMEQGVFRQGDPAPTAGLLMTLYLGIGSTVDEQGRSQIAPEWIADFVLFGLCKAG
jgi:AcrR family transcriptional regulator